MPGDKRRASNTWANVMTMSTTSLLCQNGLACQKSTPIHLRSEVFVGGHGQFLDR